ncbi:MAG: serine hydrolase [Oscillospiraceae bacterium]|nr:MAG: serine hydrolase [Oscillospiraceae bacterium]
MKRFHRRCRRLCILAALLVLLVLFLRQNVLLDTASRHAILLDAQSGQVLAQKRADERTAPASLTKMMTVLLAIETEPDLDKQVTLPEDIFPALQIEKASMAGFAPGETVTVRDLLYGAMLPSGAECCEALAQLVSGSEENFAALMNQKAAELGMKNTHFTNATGLTDTEHYSSAADMAKLLQAALHNATFRTIFTAEHYTTTATAQHPEGVSLTSTLLGKLDGTELPEGAQIEGGKTGYTAAAGLCLASLATVNGKEYILVTLAAPGDHGTEQYNIRDAVHVYRKLANKK